MDKPGRKIQLPEYCCSMDCQEHNLKADCDHDYPPEPSQNGDESVWWKCTRCGGEVSFGVFQ